MMTETLFEIYAAGPLTVVGFGGRELSDPFSLAECRDELADLVQQHQSHTLAIDLTGVRVIPSGLLGILASIHRLGVDVHLYNASRDIQDVLEITHLDRVLHLHEVEV